MAKRRSAPSRPAPPCPCGLPAPYPDCCGPLHQGDAEAATAEQLMRSRYSAFARGDSAYLLESWHSSTRPPRANPEPGVRWEGLEIIGTTDGTMDDTEGTVEFRARFADRGRPGELHEVSRFVRQDGAWVYLDGRVS
ncbi:MULTISPECIES: YchJ family protein [Thermomonosporaceae]|uniref:YchJ family protein n=1 Tax=Thermomonosporaceae TaxID=2012 RepID=UPI00255ACCAA|nr:MULTISPECIES: YchJ family protein [Thermomonosporaceae]MDL4772543.1 YchJ family protein [Actinomadura xylanilytica]